VRLDVLAKDLRFAAGLLRRRPFNCLLQVTNRCNLRCSFCDFWPNPAPPEEELTLAEMERLAADLSALGCFLVSIEGGEPFVRKDLVDIVRVFSRDHISALFTSGYYVTPDNARALWDAGLTHVSVSIDFPDALRHDQKRGVEGTTARAWQAVEILRDSAPRGGRQVNVMTVLMESNWRDMDALFRESAARGVGHQVTLLSISGTRRGKGPDRLPPPEAAAHLVGLWQRHRHLRFFRDYFERIEGFVTGGAMPTCRAGVQSFNVDHVGNVSSCIERIDTPVGNLRRAPLVELHRRLLAEQDVVARCQACWTACRGLQQAVGAGGSLGAWLDMSLRTRSDALPFEGLLARMRT
jgi:MoaA/NifB/PqqE/SkfB family radical SAM enzyme